MATVTVRTYTRNRGKEFSAIKAELENPVPLLEEMAADLIGELLNELAPHNKTGVLAQGIQQVALYQKRGRAGDYWAVGIGDPNILTDWHDKAPKGTIAAFLKWLREQEEHLPRRQAKPKRRGRTPRNKNLFPSVKELRAARNRENIKRALEELHQESIRLAHESEKIAEKAYLRLEELRLYLARRGVSYPKQRRIVLKAVSSVAKRKDPFFISSSIGQLFTLAKKLDIGSLAQLRKSKYGEAILTKQAMSDLIKIIRAREQLEQIYRKSRINK